MLQEYTGKFPAVPACHEDHHYSVLIYFVLLDCNIVQIT